MRKFYSFLLMSCILSCISFSGYSQTTTFNYTGAVQTFTVPAGVNSLAVDMSGAKGGDYPSISTGGYGGRVQCVLNVTGGQVLYIYVGQVGTNGACCGGPTPAGGINSGGGADGGSGSNSDGGAAAGAATDIRTIPYTAGATASLSSRLVVAGGGGGAGYDCSGETGGADGGPIGGSGIYCGGTGGTGGTQTAGGTGSNANGTFGAGGNANPTIFGGGGGGGWYGGGGQTYGGGGGGSSYPGVAAGNVVSITHTQGYNTTGNGKVVITVLCAAPGAIVGNTNICTGTLVTYTNPTGASGGTWSSSNTAVASINPSSGVLNVLTTGTTTLTYTVSNPCGGVGCTCYTDCYSNPIASDYYRFSYCVFRCCIHFCGCPSGRCLDKH